MTENKEIIIGIDLGTTFSCVSVVRNGQAEILEDEGRRITPSIVAFNPATDSFDVGDSARRKMTLAPKDTFYVVKRFMAMPNTKLDEVLKKHPMHYTVIQGKKSTVEFQTSSNKTFDPTFLQAQILNKMKSIAEKNLGVPIKKAVVTVPAYFSDDQRQATKDAGKIVGLEVVRIINEPTAAALAYGIDRKKKCKVAVFDLGGGTFDVSILEIDDNLFDVKATMGDPYLGGSDFDQRIVEYILDNFKKEHGIDLSKDPESYSRIREEAEKTKISLSSSLSVNINLPFITNKNGLPVHLSMDLTRAKFESLCEDLLKRTETPCRQALKDAQLTAADIDEVLLVGGMTRMPKVCEIVESIFGRQPLKTVNPDEVVAKGAAIQGGILSKTIGGDVLLLDVTPMSLGIETLGGVFTAIINRQVTIPVQKRQIFSTAYDNQTGVTIVVYQGERPIANQNKLLGQFTLEGIAPAPKGTPQIEVCFDMDANGILQVSATDLGTKKAQKIRIESGKMSEEDIQKHMEQVRLYEEQDKKALKLIEAKNSADAAIDSLDKTIREFKDKIEVDLITELNGIKDKLVEAKSSDNVEEIETLTQELNTKIQKVGEAVYKNTEAQGESQTSNENTAETAETTVE